MEERTHISATFFGALCALGAIVSFLAVTDYANARASREWPTVTGVVLSPRHAGDLRYAYFSEGRSIEGRRRAFVTRGGWRGASLPEPGTEVAVRVKPGEPAVAVLAPGGQPQLFAALITAGGLFVFVGLAGFVRAMAVMDLAEEGRRVVEPEPVEDFAAGAHRSSTPERDLFA